MPNEKKLTVNGKDLEVIDGWVSLRKLSVALGLDPERQREKAAQAYRTCKKKIRSYNGFYLQTCITEEDAQSFINSNGLWKRGRYKAKD